MPYKSRLLATTLLAASLFIGLISVYFGSVWQQHAATSATKLAALQKQGAEAGALLATADKVLNAKVPAEPLDVTLPALMLDIFNQRTPHGIALIEATAAKAPDASLSEVRALAEPVAGTGLKYVAIHLVGSYKTYSGLLDYLHYLTHKSVAISRLKIHEHTFDVTLRVYGVLAED